MTLEELRAEADKLGYKLVKANKKTYISLLPCPVCGKKRTEEWIANLNGMKSGYFRRCYYCGFDGYYGKNVQEGRAAWNKAVEVYLEQHKNKEEKENGSC